MSTPDDVVLRGSVWDCELYEDLEAKPVVVVSNDGRNRSRYEWVHVVRITTRPKRPLLAIVELSRDDPAAGRVMCDEVEPVHRDHLTRERGEVTHATLRRIDLALAHVLGLRTG